MRPRLTIQPGSATSSRRWSGTLVDSFKLNNNWAPRIGATYDLLGNGRSKIFANSGHLLRPHPERPGGARAVG